MKVILDNLVSQKPLVTDSQVQEDQPFDWEINVQ